ncbi:uncharacterized protein LOC130296304 [Hyla sarda]|uniref:uncharacterized protein LOC130296304 n=1 Tax=Hyla sarda TaxID=327740 RepID=UPI0024C39830|nr:uncharacterized protein LOC130296304 [Hyla sarda]
MMGWHGQLPKDRTFGLQAPFNNSPQASMEWVSDHQRRIQEAKEIVNKKMGEAQQKQKQDFNRDASAKPLQLGDKVWLRKFLRSHKLDSIWEKEPYTITTIPYPDSDMYGIQKTGYEPQVFFWLISVSVIFTASGSRSNMDFRQHEQTWLSQLDEVFRDSPGAVLNVNGQDMRDNITKLKALLHRRTRTWWNKVFLEKYLSQGLIPRGLRVQMCPSFPVNDAIFKNKWEDLASHCSRGVMELLVQLNGATLSDIEKEIETTQYRIGGIIPKMGKRDQYNKI